MSETPRTDAASWREHQQSVVDADFARQLERELAQRTAERDEARRWLCRKTVYAERKPHDSVDSTEAKVLLEAQMRGWDCFKEVKS
jgi:hypothetical protein